MKLRDCPDCNTHMQPFWLPAKTLGSEVELDRCADCGGVWFDAGELVAASSKEVRATSTKTDRPCPSCTAMLVQGRIVDGPAVETCASCRGTFLEARDLDALAKKARQSTAPSGTGFVCDSCGERKPFSAAQATLTGLECAECVKRQASPQPSAEREEKRSAFAGFLGWLRGA